MKYLRYITASAAALLLASCTLKIEKTCLPSEDEYVAPVMLEVGDVISDLNSASEEKVIYTWQSADYGVNAGVTYTVYAQIGESVALLGVSNTNYLEVSKGDVVGTLCNDLGAPENKTVEVSTYVEAELDGSATSTTLKSNIVSYNVYTFIAPIRCIYLPGRYQEWVADGTAMWETSGGTNTYKMLVDVSNDNPDDWVYYFKIYDKPTGSWWGFNDFEPLWTVADPAKDDGNFSVTKEEPIIIVTINAKKKTIDREVISAVTMIGDFNGWTEKTTEPKFTYDAANNVWLSPAIDFTEGGGWLLRLNHDWGRKFGGGTKASKYIEGGLDLEEGGDAANIPAPGTGTYVVKLHANRTPYVIEYVQQ